MILPASIDVVSTPEYLSPTQVGAAGACILHGILASTKVKAQRLLSHPAAELGSIFHRLLEMSIRGQLPPSDGILEQAVRSTLSTLLVEAATRLGEDKKRCHYSDLATTVTPLQWRRKVRAVVETAIRMAGRPTGPINAHGSSLYYPELPGTGPWTEVGIRVPRLRLEGRMDVVERVGRKVVVRDMKTGRVTDDTGEILPSILSQMTLYGIMAVSLDPDKSVSLVVDSADEILIPFGPAKARKAEEDWNEKLGKIPPSGTDCRADSMAVVGEDCLKCSHRHVCQMYLAAAPTMWKETSEFRLPCDTWGQVVKLQRNGCDDSAIVLEDDAGRLVKVTGLRDQHIEDIKLSKKVWLFNLYTADRSTVRNGKWHHPRNFHEIPEGLADHRAWNLDVYVST